MAIIPSTNPVLQSEEAFTGPEDGPNQPIGEAKGIIPGRVVWMHSPDATNENCKSSNYGDGYFLDKNADQELIDEMLHKAMLEITGEDSDEKAWLSVFKFFNKNHIWKQKQF